jgi:hypothetical protein
VALGIAVALVACARTSPGPTVTVAVTTSAAVISTEAAAKQFAKARCEREAECNLREAKQYRHRSDCVTDTRETAFVDTGLGACNSGALTSRIDQCVADLQRQRCEDDMGSVTSLPECKRSMCSP